MWNSGSTRSRPPSRRPIDLPDRRADTRRRLERELAQIAAHVERALFYARAESPEKDLVIRETSLEELADQALQNHRALLIQSGVRAETRDLDQRVYTDGKWVCFLLGQLLQERPPATAAPSLSSPCPPGTGEAGGADSGGQRYRHPRP